MTNLDQLSGANNYQSTRMPVYDEISLDGNFGIYNIKLKTEPKVKVVEEGVEKEKYLTKEIGKRIELVWLKVRRQLVEGTQEGILRQTNEHDTKFQEVTITHFDGRVKEKMLASTINGQDGKYPKMKVRQIIYALNLDDGKIYRLISKGMSNSMQEKPEDATLFFDYVFEFTGDERFYKITNVMESREIKTKIGMKFYSNFSRGRELTEKEMALVTEKIKEVNDAIVKAESAPQVETTQVETDVIDYDAGEANVEDIPF